MFKTASESHALSMDFRSFDNGFKQLCVTNSMQEYRAETWFFMHLCLPGPEGDVKIEGKTGFIQASMSKIQTS